MADLYISEYRAIGVSGGFDSMPKEPSLATQKVSFTTTTQSAAFSKKTTIIRVKSSADCHLSFGTNPTATTSSMHLSSGQYEWFAVKGGHKVAAVTAS